MSYIIRIRSSLVSVKQVMEPYLFLYIKEDIHGRLKQESLTDRFQIDGLVKIKRGVVWNLSAKRGNINAIINEILETNILFNPLSHECYRIN